jgi:hypothetical protein
MNSAYRSDLSANGCRFDALCHGSKQELGDINWGCGQGAKRIFTAIADEPTHVGFVCPNGVWGVGALYVLEQLRKMS